MNEIWALIFSVKPSLCLPFFSPSVFLMSRPMCQASQGELLLLVVSIKVAAKYLILDLQRFKGLFQWSPTDVFKIRLLQTVRLFTLAQHRFIYCTHRHQIYRHNSYCLKSIMVHNNFRQMYTIFTHREKLHNGNLSFRNNTFL